MWAAFENNSEITTDAALDMLKFHCVTPFLKVLRSQGHN